MIEKFSSVAKLRALDSIKEDDATSSDAQFFQALALDKDKRVFSVIDKLTRAKSTASSNQLAYHLDFRKQTSMMIDQNKGGIDLDETLSSPKA